MSKNRIAKRMAAVLAAFLLVLNVSGIVWADPEVEEPVPEETAAVEQVPEELPPEPVEEVPAVVEEIPVEPENPVSFGLEAQGNMTLQDDIEGEQAQSLEFITVNTRDGHTFYIVIERYETGDNVHFLNQVDASDLQAILAEVPEGLEVTEGSSVTDPFETLVPTEVSVLESDIPQQEEPGQKTDYKKSLYTFAAVIVLIGAVAGIYYIVKIRPKKGRIDDTREFDDDEEYEAEDRDEYEKVEDRSEDLSEEEYEEEYEEE